MDQLYKFLDPLASIIDSLILQENESSKLPNKELDDENWIVDCNEEYFQVLLDFAIAAKRKNPDR